jgi:3,5-epimerase/4-reductase
MNKKILIFGKGFIGGRLAEEMDCEISSRRINSPADAEDEIASKAPGIVINCIGYTGKKNVDDCERNTDKTFFANTFVPVMLAEAACKHGAKLVHISSGCIYKYDYKSLPIDENAAPDFFGLTYARSKIYAEQALRSIADEYGVLILRIRIPLDDRPHPRNLLTKLLEHRRVIDAPNSVTYIPDFIKAVRHLIGIDAIGIFNVVNKGGLSYPALMDEYSLHVPDFRYETISCAELGLLRTNIILSTEKLEKSGLKVRKINKILEKCVKNYLRH